MWESDKQKGGMEDTCMMKTAGHTMGTPEYSLYEAADLFSSMGFQGIEVIWDDEYSCALRKNASVAELRTFREYLKGRKLNLCCLTPYMHDIDSLNEDVRQLNLADFRGCIDAAQILDAPVIRAYGGSFFPEEAGGLEAADGRANQGRAEKEIRLVQSLQELGEYAGDRGVSIAVETHFNTLSCTAKETADIIRAVDSPYVGVLYDQPNLAFVGAEAHAEALNFLQSFIRHVHVKDFRFLGDNREFKASYVATIRKDERITHSTIVGEGIIAWDEILGRLSEVGYDGYLSFEYERRWFPDEIPDAAVGMRKSLENIRVLLASL